MSVDALLFSRANVNAHEGMFNREQLKMISQHHRGRQWLTEQMAELEAVHASYRGGTTRAEVD